MSAAEDLARLVRGGEAEHEKFSSLLDDLGKKIEKKKVRVGDVATMIKSLSAAERHFRSQKRKGSDPNTWNTLLTRSQQFLKLAQEMNTLEVPTNREEEDNSADGENSLPKNISQYLNRLKRDKKELYKNPPVLPPPKIVMEETSVKSPSRDAKTGRLTFLAGKDSSLKKVLKDFHPNQTPAEVLRGGGFGGTYFRTIKSSVNNKTYNGNEVLADTIPEDWIKGLDKKRMLTSSTYKVDVNRYGVKCGGSLGMWESSGWISDIDPYGWFQWYCRFYQGRRCSDDARQISRWLGVAGPKGRFRSQLCNKILSANTSVDDAAISPVIRQTLFHWGLSITNDILEEHKKRNK
ncbi:hypothetical protein FisN_22Lh248 [Fistulifera solaris]|uniref:Uncharacterized protein n=1 Tax=Fistulifera solaris TaxID=1519565 RepID=A0A1Z5JCR0_FISSO|nr:hypothetical protein FisN_22Lh248 [Fistulifera solaris]|eukprot:GAX11558.1 hypothetical protein FisN_22Lh248 [Fistulifera solaris]